MQEAKSGGFWGPKHNILWFENDREGFQYDRSKIFYSLFIDGIGVSAGKNNKIVKSTYCGYADETNGRLFPMPKWQHATNANSLP